MCVVCTPSLDSEHVREWFLRRTQNKYYDEFRFNDSVDACGSAYPTNVVAEAVIVCKHFY